MGALKALLIERVEFAPAVFDRVPEFLDEWRRDYFSTRRPDREAVDEAIKGLYSVMNLRGPYECIWVKTPGEAQDVIRHTSGEIRPYNDNVFSEQGGISASGAWEPLYALCGGTITNKPQSFTLFDQNIMNGLINQECRDQVFSIIRPKSRGCMEQLVYEPLLHLAYLWVPFKAVAALAFVYNTRYRLAPKLALYNALYEFAEIEKPPALEHVTTLFKNCSAWAFSEDFAVACELPTHFHLDARGTINCDDQPALAWGDDRFSQYWRIRDVLMDNYEMNELLKRNASSDYVANKIFDQQNSEVRRVLMELYGSENILTALKAKRVHQDKYGVLWNLGPRWNAGPPRLYVQVFDETKQGAKRNYLLRVPHTMKKAKEAVAWTFSMGEKEYCPEVET